MSSPIMSLWVDGQWINWDYIPGTATSVPLDPPDPSLARVCPACEEDYYIHQEALFFGVVIWRCGICDHYWEVLHG